jgi:hypothetical protein
VIQTLTETLFGLDAELHPFSEIMRARSALRTVICAARPRLYYCRTAKSTASLMHRVVTRDLDVEYRQHRSGDDFSLTRIINEKSASCLGAALVNLAVAEPLGIHVQAVLYDQHIGLRYTADREACDIEPCCGNHPLPVLNGHMRRRKSDGIPLTRNQLISLVRVNLTASSPARRHEKARAIAQLDGAITFFPEFSESYIKTSTPPKKGRI